MPRESQSLSEMFNSGAVANRVVEKVNRRMELEKLVGQKVTLLISSRDFAVSALRKNKEATLAEVVDNEYVRVNIDGQLYTLPIDKIAKFRK